MNQSRPLYDMTSALETLEPWLEQHLPDLEPVARRHFVHLVTGISEQPSLLIRAIASASPFQAEPESNYTQVQRIIRDTRVTLETVSYPVLMQLLAALPGQDASITRDETAHTDAFNLILVGWATEAVSLPLGFVIDPTDGSWADDARTLLQRLAQGIPSERPMTLLADRIHASEAFLSCLDELGWNSIIRLPADPYSEPAQDGWHAVRHVRKRRGHVRVFGNVRIWNGSNRRAPVCLYRHPCADGTTTTWYLVTKLEGEQVRFVEYACRWWQACPHELLKSALFEWERGRVSDPSRVTMLLMGFGCACWALGLLGRAKERLARRKPTTTRTQLRRQKVIKRGWEVLQAARKRRGMPSIPQPPAPRGLEYQKRFPGFRLSCDAASVELWRSERMFVM
jgi:hypothetical protein